MSELVERLRLPMIVGLLLAIAAAGVIIYLKLPRSAATIEILVPTPSPTGEKLIVVYVSGAVARPGVYKVSLSDRVDDAVKAAGGTTPEANLDAINLAAKLRDEMHVYVPKVGEPASTIGGNALSQKISVNTGSVEQLESLPGVGSVTAKRIIDYRSKNGPFKSIEELRDLKLVNSSTFDKIKDLIAP